MEIKEIQNKEIWENFLLEGEENKFSSSPFAVAREGEENKFSSSPFAVAREGEENKPSSSAERSEAGDERSSATPFAVARECDEKTFLSSWNWGEFQKLMGNKIWRLGVFERDELISVALIIRIVAKRGTFLFLPHVPSVASAKEGGPAVKYEILKTLLEELKKIAKAEKASFIRISPIWKRNEENIKVFKKLGFRDAPIHMHAEVTWELNISPSDEELLMGMRKTTRYLIRQAQKNKDIEIYQSPASAKASAGKQNLGDIEKFNNLYQETVDRQHFVPFSLDYLKNEFFAFQPDNQISIFFGKYKNEIIATGVFIFWSNFAFYHHGATSLKFPKIPVSYLLMWRGIQEAKRRGCQKFNFWGIAPENKKNHPWAGLTLFKMGFGGSKKEYVKTQDLPLSKRYLLTFLFEKVRKTKRGL